MQEVWGLGRLTLTEGRAVPGPWRLVTAGGGGSGCHEDGANDHHQEGNSSNRDNDSPASYSADKAQTKTAMSRGALSPPPWALMKGLGDQESGRRRRGTQSPDSGAGTALLRAGRGGQVRLSPAHHVSTTQMGGAPQRSPQTWPTPTQALASAPPDLSQTDASLKGT